MSPLSNKSSNDKADSRGLCISDWIAEAFECYQVPPNLGEEVIDPLDEHTLHSYQSCYLGPAYFKFDALPASQVHFYKVTRSEISEPTYDIKLKQHLYCSPVQCGNDSMDPHDSGGARALSYLERSEALLLPLSETPSLVMSQDDSTLSIMSATPSTPGDTIGTTIALPPKKRKKRRIVRHAIIFTLATECDPHHDLSSLPTEGGAFYVFPQNALVDAMNDMAPFLIFCTFYLSKSPSILRNSSSKQYRTNLEGLTTVCDSNNRLVSTKQLQNSFSADSDHHSINIEISGASGDIYHSLKQTVSEYQVMCQKMEKLLCVHKQHLNDCKSEMTCHHERPSAPASHDTTDHPNTRVKIDTAQSLHDRHDGEQHCDMDQQNGTNIQNNNNSVKRRYIKQKDSQQNSFKITKRTDNKKIYNHTGNSVNGSIKTGTGVKDRAAPATMKKSKRTSLHRDKNHSNPANIRQCFYCGVTETPMWRRGPDGGTLCNACGVKWKNGKILFSKDTLLTADQKVSGNTKQNSREHTSKRKPSINDVTKEKRIKTTNFDTTTGSKDSGLHEYSNASTFTDHHLQLYHTSSSNDIGIMDSLKINATTITSPTASTTLAGDHTSIRLATLGSSSSNDLICNSPPLVPSFNSSTVPLDIQKHSVLLCGKLGPQDDTVSLTPGTDDFEAAALLTLLSQS